MKRVVILIGFLILMFPIVFALENDSLTSFLQEKIENESGAPILNDTSKTVWTFEEVVNAAVYFVIILFVLVAFYLLYEFFRRRGNRKRMEMEDNIGNNDISEEEDMGNEIGEESSFGDVDNKNLGDGSGMENGEISDNFK